MMRVSTTHHDISCIILQFYYLTDFFVGFEQPTYNVPEGVGVTSVCVVVTEAPAGGFESMPIVSLMSRNRDNAGLYICNMHGCI